MTQQETLKATLTNIMHNSNYVFHINVLDWGISIHIIMIDKNLSSNGYVRIFSYNDQPEILFASDLHIDDESQNRGLGTQLLTFLDVIAKELKYRCIALSVLENTWQYDWYIRTGYEFFQTKLEGVWLVKML